jgi:hypothetical protein
MTEDSQSDSANSKANHIKPDAKTRIALGRSSSLTESTERMKQSLLKADEVRMHSEMLARVRESKKPADAAYNSQDYSVALMLYKQIEDDLNASGHQGKPVMIPYKARILACMWNLHQDEHMEAYLKGALAIFGKQRQDAINLIDKTGNSADTWTELALASKVVAQRKYLEGSREDYLKAAKDFFELARTNWSRPKDDIYRVMIGQYCTVLRTLGDVRSADALERTEHPIYQQPPSAPTAAKPSSSSNRTKSHDSRYVHNYHFKHSN